MILRCMFLTDHPSSTNRAASQSSNSGWVGGVPNLPKLLGVRTMPSPKCFCQMRLTITRAVRGFCGEAIQSASSKRPLPAVTGS